MTLQRGKIGAAAVSAPARYTRDLEAARAVSQRIAA
jgi:hypothetical protein